MKLPIPTNTIKAAIQCAAIKDVRYYLNGALITYDAPDHRLRIVSTDGNVLSRFEHTLPEYEGESCSLIVPIDALKQAAKHKGQVVYLEHIAEKKYSLGGALFEPIGDHYPDYARIIPQTVTGEVAQFNPDLLVRCNDALRIFYGSKGVYRLYHNGSSAALMGDISAGAFCVVMPYNDRHVK